MQSVLLEDKVSPNKHTDKFLSPLRYPGGKSWLIPIIRTWFLHHTRNSQQITLIEPFLGGGIVTLTALFEGLCKQAITSEIDPDIASVWKVILSDSNSWLAQKVLDFDFNLEMVAQIIADEPSSIENRAFKTILRNRINRGGILAPGAGKIKLGESSKGLASRWYAQTLSKRIKAIYDYKNSMIFVEGDGMDILKSHLSNPDCMFFIDPPYPKVGSRLYTYHALDHNELFETISKTDAPALLTYNDTEEIRTLAQKFHFFCHEVEMKTTHHKKRNELIISKSKISI